jgi:phosphoribosylformylglycinamidine synthase
MIKDNLQYTFYIEEKCHLTNNDYFLLLCIVSSNFSYPIQFKSKYKNKDSILEIGPHKNFKTQWNTTMINLLQKCGIFSVKSIEYSICYSKDNVPNYDKMMLTTYNNLESDNEIVKTSSHYVDICNLDLSYEDIDYYKSLLNRNYTNVEIYDLMQFNSEHARHHFFRGKLIENNTVLKLSLFDRIKKTKYNTKNSIVSFKDNASVINGDYVNYFYTNYSYRKCSTLKVKLHYSFKAETHNFPTAISPFPGAATGVGGRIRDTICVGRGGQLISGLAGYSVGDINPIKSTYYDKYHNDPLTILIEASNGASDYGNKIGEPLIGGFTREYKSYKYEYVKPIMFSAGMGRILDSNICKNKSEPYLLIGRVGGAAYRIGMGGGEASSRVEVKDNDFNAVQRGDPFTANKVVKFIRECSNCNINPILSLHDQGSGGMANVTRELIEPYGANIFIDKVFTGDDSLGTLEKWVAEYQEQISFLFDLENIDIITEIARRENVSFVTVGYVNKNNLIVKSKHDSIEPVNLPSKIPVQNKVFHIKQPINNKKRINKSSIFFIDDMLYFTKNILQHLSVCSKQFLTNKVDRSVGGLVVQQQCIGPYHLPLSNYSIVNACFNSINGLVTAIGEQPSKGIEINGNYNVETMIRMTISEMLLNIVWVSINKLTSINCAANWMWPSKEPEDAWLLNKGVDTLVESLNILGISINGGKDSLSMSVKLGDKTIKSPPTLVLSGYTTSLHNSFRITPEFKQSNSHLLYISFNKKIKYRLGGSVFSQKYNISGLNYSMPDVDDWNVFMSSFNMIQFFIFYNYILSGHDISDGGLITTLTEMAISSNIGFDICIDNSDAHYINYFYSEEPGIVIEVSDNHIKCVMEKLLYYDVKFNILGKTCSTDECKIKFNNNIILNTSVPTLKYAWNKTSYEIELKQCNPICVKEELKTSMCFDYPKYYISDTILKKINLLKHKNSKNNHKIAILSDEGSNGDNEMAFCFNEVGFDVYNINMNDLIHEKYNINDFRGIAFVGGFTHSDIPQSAYGWYFTIINNPLLKDQFDTFHKRKDTFSFGVCNGCQLMALLQWIDVDVRISKNISERFESRFSYVKIEKSNAIMLKNMEKLQIGVWSNHGEGNIIYDKDKDISPIKYIDTLGFPTTDYPHNPNGSYNGRCSIVSKNGRHFAMMPHPERCIFKWQMPWVENTYSKKLKKYMPWILMFKNAYDWCNLYTER